MGVEPQTKVTLTVIEGPEAGKLFEFTEQDNFLLGRDAKGCHAHFRLGSRDEYVSRNHFLLEINPPDCYLKDAGSKNGTFVIRRDGPHAVFFLKGREERDWVERAQYLEGLYRCTSHQEVEKRLQLEDGDLIRVGKTIIAVKMVQANDQEAQPEEVCIRCGKKLSGEIPAKAAEQLTFRDFLCEECCRKQDQRAAPQEAVICWGCGKDLTSPANSDGRAEEFKDVALYWCESCASSKQEKVPLSHAGDYRILRELGAGGFGVVYLGWHERSRRIAAVKLTKAKIKRSERLLRRFKREITIMAEFRHPHLVRLYDEGVIEDGTYYFASEYLSEGSLADLFHQRGRMPYNEAGALMIQALEGLSYFHEKGYVHRDLKPENILLRKDGQGVFIARVGDYGLARSYILHGGTITKEGEWAGTAVYCPPEQITDFKNVKPPTDIYALGISLYLLITGEFPYDFPTRKELLKMLSAGKKPRDPISIILGDDRPTPIERKQPGIPKDLAKAINRAIDKDASKRFESAKAFQEALERSLT